MPDAAGNLAKANNYADAQVDKSRGVCSTCSVSQYAPRSTFLRGIFHNYDSMFYYYDLRHNASERVQHYLNIHKT